MIEIFSPKPTNTAVRLPNKASLLHRNCAVLVSTKRNSRLVMDLIVSDMFEACPGIHTPLKQNSALL